MKSGFLKQIADDGSGGYSISFSPIAHDQTMSQGCLSNLADLIEISHGISSKSG